MPQKKTHWNKKKKEQLVLVDLLIKKKNLNVQNETEKFCLESC